MSAWELVPRAVRRKAIAIAIAIALTEPSNVRNVRPYLAKLKAEHTTTRRLLKAMVEAIEETEALLSEVRA